MFYDYVALGVCARCNGKILVPAFTFAKLDLTCPCQDHATAASDPIPERREPVEDADPDEADTLDVFDNLVAEYAMLHLADLSADDITPLFLRASADLGLAQAAFLDGGHKQALAFILRVSAMLRHIAAMHPEFASLIHKYSIEEP